MSVSLRRNGFFIETFPEDFWVIFITPNTELCEGLKDAKWKFKYLRSRLKPNCRVCWGDWGKSGFSVYSHSDCLHPWLTRVKFQDLTFMVCCLPHVQHSRTYWYFSQINTPSHEFITIWLLIQLTSFVVFVLYNCYWHGNIYSDSWPHSQMSARIGLRSMIRLH